MKAVYYLFHFLSVLHQPALHIVEILQHLFQLIRRFDHFPLVELDELPQFSCVAILLNTLQ